MSFSVYILESETSGRLYIGHTTDVERRLAEHNAGHTISTRGRGPWRLMGTKQFATRAEAAQCERKLKQWKKPSRVREWISQT